MPTDAEPPRVWPPSPAGSRELPIQDKAFPATITSGGVTLYLDAEEDLYYLQVPPGAEQKDIASLMRLAYSQGLELIDDSEDDLFDGHPVEQLIREDDSIRLYFWKVSD
ncbi:hypothetical protein [Kribbella deserti]|uniref:Uncharacterized protein n=1 Tax=Kribbella deserti TaxID=1926257 RepID=A0ABV6QGE1_9ACTN